MSEHEQAATTEEGGRTRGFTLIELMVALALGLAVTAAAMGVLLSAVSTQKEGTMRAELARDAQLTMDLLTRDLSYLGAGVPRGFESAPAGNLLATGVGTLNATIGYFNGRADRQLRPPIRIARNDYIAFLGDLPYPNAELSGIVGVNHMSTAATTTSDVAVVSELSPCSPENGATNYVCDTSDESLIQWVGTADCAAGTLTTSPTCPWGMKKWQVTGATNPRLVVGAVDGSWFRREWNMSSIAAVNERMAITLTGGALPVNRFVESSLGGGYMANIDRVFWSLENKAGGAACGGSDCTLWRKQCWGWTMATTQPNAAGFPGLNASVIRSGASPADCGDPDNGTPWEKVMSDIKSLNIRYFRVDNLNTALTPTTGLAAQQLAQARVIEIDLEMKRDIPGTTPTRSLTQRMKRRLHMENAGGLVTYENLTAEASGGCYRTADFPNECNPQ